MMMRLFLASICCLIFLMCSRAQDPKLEKGAVRLDNGKDLTGWTGMKDGWTVKEGAIHLDAKLAKENIYHEKTHSADVVIRLEFRASEGADSGLYVFGKQFQVRDYPKVGPAKYAEFAKPAGEWNTLELDFTDNVAVVTLNGKVIEKAWKIGIDPKKGIGLEADKGDFDFRSITTREKK
ncbi:MAG: DUF1080 domain-containing protein [Planctomycetes bacterium]|nr:DUF1080 domain-containing protein [Planctomycetota bacterium]